MGELSDILNQASFDPEDISVPRESRKQRSCGIALVMFSSRVEARSAIAQLDGAKVRDRVIHASTTDGSAAGSIIDDLTGNGPDNDRRLQWKQDDELWDVALFDRNESVSEFNGRLQSHTAPAAPANHVEATARFQAAVTRERAEERKLVQEALVG